MKDLREYLNAGNILIADGATGTMLQAAGLPPGTPPDLWNVENPAAIRGVYRAYLDAGAQVILANTFGGNPIRLRIAGRLEERMAELNRAAVTLAKEEAVGQAYVAADMGPTGELLAPLGTLSYEDAVVAFAAQARVLAESEADLIWIETMSDVNEARAAVEGIKQVTDLPVFCSLSFELKKGKARTMMGVSPRQTAETLWHLGLTAIGANCGDGLEVMTPVLTEFRAALPDAVLIAKPNAGLPRMVDDETVFDLGAEEMAAHMPHLVELGAQVIGGCCGSTPAHIAAIAAALS